MLCETPDVMNKCSMRIPSRRGTLAAENKFCTDENGRSNTGRFCLSWKRDGLQEKMSGFKRINQMKARNMAKVVSVSRQKFKIIQVCRSCDDSISQRHFSHPPKLIAFSIAGCSSPSSTFTFSLSASSFTCFRACSSSELIVSVFLPRI